MLRKFVVFILISAATCAVAFAQDKEPKEIERTLSVFSGFGGSYLGVQLQEVTKENFSKFGLSDVRGVAVEKVVEKSPAAAGNMQNGDVVVRFNGEEVTSVNKLRRLISETAPDHQARITVLRGGRETELNVTMGKHPTPQFEQGAFSMAVPMPVMPSMPRVPMGQLPHIQVVPDGEHFMFRGNGDAFTFFGGGRQIGVEVDELGKQLGEYFGVQDGKGLLISSVVENSPAAKAELRAGDVITEVDGKAVNNTGDLVRAINEKKEGEITLTIIRSRDKKTVKVTPEKREMPKFKEFKPGEGQVEGFTYVAPGARVTMNPAPPQVRTVPNVRIAPAVRVVSRKVIL